MKLWENIKTFFQGKDENKEIVVENKKENTVNIEGSAGESDARKKLAERAYRAKAAGDYEKALTLWDKFCEEYPDNLYQARARKAKIFILMGEEEKARKELLEFSRWYLGKGSVNYSSSYFTIFISVLQDLGFLAENWIDSDKFLKNLAGEEVTLDKSLTIDRINRGLEVLKEEGLKSKNLEDIVKNMRTLS